MTLSNSNVLFLTGGLGNQLFQLGYGLSATSNTLLLDSINGNPRTSKTHKPDILDFKLPNRVKVLNLKPSKLISKVLSYNLRIEIVPKKVESILTVRKLVRIISSPILSIYYKRPIGLKVCRGVGFDGFSPRSTSSKVLVGYYQSFNWLDDRSKGELTSLELSAPSIAFQELLVQIKTQPTYIVHIRLGDYLQESNFGTPSSEYYKSAIETLRAKSGQARIWGFSDEPEKAKAILETAGIFGVFWVSPSAVSSAETLQLMREGSGFVLANSTFSWWAAMLRRNEDAPVIAPIPWFRAMEEPNLLVPPTWVRIQAY